MTVDDGNGRVSMAILATKLDNIEGLLKAHIRDDECDHADFETRIRTLTNNQTVIRERQNILAGFNATLSVIASAIAGFLGVRF